MCTEPCRMLMKTKLSKECAMFMTGKFIIKFMCKFEGPNTETPISKMKKEGRAVVQISRHVLK